MRVSGPDVPTAHGRACGGHPGVSWEEQEAVVPVPGEYVYIYIYIRTV